MASITVRIDDETILGHIDARGLSHDDKGREGANQGGTRGGRSEVIRNTIDRYYTLLTHARQTIRDTFTDAELMLIFDACNGVGFDPDYIPYLYIGVSDAIKFDRLDTKWEVDGMLVVAKLQALNETEAFALVDIIERFWRQPGGKFSIEEALAELFGTTQKQKMLVVPGHD